MWYRRRAQEQGYAVKQLDGILKMFGNYGKVVLRSGGEVAIKDLLQKVGETRASQTLIETIPKGDSRANGRAERAVQRMSTTSIMSDQMEEQSMKD